MKSLLFTLLVALGTLGELAAQCQIITLPYGQVEIDINRGYKIIPTQDGNFVIAGEWNNEAFLLKVNAQGQQLALKKYGSAITGQSLFQDVVEASDGGFVAVGECNNCVVPNDSLTKVIAIKTDANLNLDAAIGVKKFGTVTLPGGFVTTNRQTSARIVRTADTYLLATRLVLGAAINWENTGVTKLSAALAPLWVKSYNAGYVEAPAGLVATADGFIIPVNRSNIPPAALLKINGNGDQVWIKTFEANQVRGITYLPGADDVVVIGDRTPAGEKQQAFLMRFNAATGVAKDSLLFGDDLDDYGYDVQTLPNGDLLAGIVSNRPNLFGIYATSRIYRINADPLDVNCYYLVPNPDNITNMSVRSIVPLNGNGKDFAVTGIRGFYNRTFFHTRMDCEVTEVSATICPGDSYTLPDGVMASVAGTYNTTLTAMSGCDSVVQITLSVFPTIPPKIVNVTICPGDSYTLPNGVSVTLPGVYNVTLPTSNGCDSLIQTTVSLYAPILVTEVNVTLCPGESYTLPNGQSVSAAGIYDVILIAANGCDSLVRTTVTNLTSPQTSVAVGLCPGESYTLPDGQSVSAAGVYDVTLTASNGCDSLVRTTVTNLTSPLTSVAVGLCPGESYILPDGQTVSAAGVYDVILSAANGCDSLVRTTVTSLIAPFTAVNVQLCPGESHTLPNGQTVSTVGIYDVVFTASNGCDSLVQTTLAYFDPIPPVEVSVDLCPGETYTLPNGQVVSAPGIYEVTLVAPNGCDFVEVTTVEGLISPIHVVDVDLCPGETYTLPNGQVVNTAGTYDVEYVGENGCDSTVRTVVEQLDAPIIWVDVVLCAGGFYVLPNGDTVTSGSYEFPYIASNGCEGIMIIGILDLPSITVENVEIQADNGQGSGSISLIGVSGGTGTGYHYLWNNGATTSTLDSLTFGTYKVTITDAIGCTEIFTFIVQTTGLNDHAKHHVSFRLFPNPFSDQIQVSLELEQPSNARFEIRLNDARGRLYKSVSLDAGAIRTLDTADLPAGVYFVQLLENERLVMSRRVVKM